MYVKKAELIRLPHGGMQLKLNEQRNFKVFTEDSKLKFWVYEKTIPGGSEFGTEDGYKVRDITEQDIQAILANNATCYIQVDNYGTVTMPSNGYGERRIVIHLTCTNQGFEEYPYIGKRETSIANVLENAGLLAIE